MDCSELWVGLNEPLIEIRLVMFWLMILFLLFSSYYINILLSYWYVLYCIVLQCVIFNATHIYFLF